MKFLVILAVVAFVAARPDEKHEKQKPNVYEKLKNFDVDPIVGNIRLMTSYATCWEGETKCVGEANDIKGVMPEAMKTNCGECSEFQKVQVAKFMKSIKENIPEHWEKLNKKFNPDGTYTEGFNEFIEKYSKA